MPGPGMYFRSPVCARDAELAQGPEQAAHALRRRLVEMARELACSPRALSDRQGMDDIDPARQAAVWLRRHAPTIYVEPLSNITLCPVLLESD